MELQLNWSPISRERGRKKRNARGPVRWPCCGTIRTAKTTRYHRDGTKECLKCLQAKTAKQNEMVFPKCGHPKTDDNIQINAGRPRCKKCHRAKNNEAKYRPPPCALALLWAAPITKTTTGDRTE